MSEIGFMWNDENGVYKGDLRYNVPDGFGEWLGINGSYYVGNWYDGKFEGIGELVYNHNKYIYGGRYIGEFRNGLRHGKGEIYIDKNETSFYKGDWYNNKPDGHGTIVFENGDKYEGSFIEGSFDGYGTYITIDYQVYEGHWYNNRIDGKSNPYWGSFINNRGKYDNIEVGYKTPKIIIYEDYCW